MKSKVPDGVRLNYFKMLNEHLKKKKPLTNKLPIEVGTKLVNNTILSATEFMAMQRAEEREKLLPKE